MPATIRTLTAAACFAVSAGIACAGPAAVASNLNLRSGPGAGFAVIDIIPAGARFDVQRCQGDWCSVRHGRRTGYISREALTGGGDAYASAAPAPVSPREAAPTLAGPRIWRWRDPDWRDRHWRDIEWQNRHARP